MMIDSKLELGDALDLAALNAASGVGAGNILDLGAAGKDGWGNTLTESPGEGQSLFWIVQINTTMSAHALTLAMQHAATVASSALASATTLVTFTIPSAAAAGQRYVITLPQGGMARYLRMHATQNNSATGKIDSWISSNPADSETALK